MSGYSVDDPSVRFTTEIDVDALFKWAPSISLQTGILTRSRYLVFGEFGYTLVRFKDRATLPVIGPVSGESSSLHLWQLTFGVGANVIGTKLPQSSSALYLGLAGHLGTIQSEIIPGSSASGGRGLSGVMMAERVISRSFDSFVTIVPSVMLNLAGHNWPTYHSIRIGLRFYR